MLLRTLADALVAVCQFLASQTAPQPSQPAPQVGQPAPDFTLNDSAGSPVKLSAYKGKVLPRPSEDVLVGCAWLRGGIRREHPHASSTPTKSAQVAVWFRESWIRARRSWRESIAGSVLYVELEVKGSPYRAQALRDLRCLGKYRMLRCFSNTMLLYA